MRAPDNYYVVEWKKDMLRGPQICILNPPQPIPEKDDKDKIEIQFKLRV